MKYADQIYSQIERMMKDNPNLAEMAARDDVGTHLGMMGSPKSQALLSAAALVIKHKAIQANVPHVTKSYFIEDRRFGGMAFDILVTQFDKIEKYGEKAYPMSQRQVAAIKRALAL